jgi:hypothetical protein
MGAASPSPSNFEFLEYAPRRFDGGPEVEWITWLEDQHRAAVQVAERHRPARQRSHEMEDLMLTEHERLMAVQQFVSQPNELNTSYFVMDERPALAARRSLLNVVFTPIFNIGLAICGLFVSVVLFNILFRGLPSHRRQYEGHNRQVFEQSLQVLQHGLVRLVSLPVNVVTHCMRRD